MLYRFFYAHGELCASHPWEVMVGTLALTVCMFTVDRQNSVSTKRVCSTCHTEAEYNAIDVILMTLIRCIAILYLYYQFCNLRKIGSKYIIGIAGLFTVISSIVFSTTVLTFLHSDVSDLKDALFFFLLLIDLSKAATLAHLALSSSNKDEIRTNIAKGMAMLGPTITVDTVVETLLIGVGTLSGVRRLEMLSYFACFSVLVNYVVFISFYPACLSLMLELSRNVSGYSLLARAFPSEDIKVNPVVQQVKIIMSAGLMLVHAHLWWPSKTPDDFMQSRASEEDSILEGTDDELSFVKKWIVISAEHIVVLIVLSALFVKFVFFESKRIEENKLIKAAESLDLVDLNMPATIPKEDKESQTDAQKHETALVPMPQHEKEINNDQPMRSIDECLSIYKSELGAGSLTDQEIIQLVHNKHIPAYDLEKSICDPVRGVKIRRYIVGQAGRFSHALTDLPYLHYDYSKVMGSCCENVIGYVPVPVGYAGPLLLDGRLVYVPMATTEGCLVASTNRGCRALARCGVKTRIVADGMTRGPVVRFTSAARASEVMIWMEQPENYQMIKKSFDDTSRFARLTRIHTRIAGRYLFIRFVAKTGDAMGMNMLSKGTESSLKFVKNYFPEMEILSLSGNFCTDKKPAAVNWIEGRGKSVVCEAVIPSTVVVNTLKTSVQALVDVNISKNMIGSAIAGSIGGFNAHAANIVTAIFIATGQDPAQNVASSNCMTLMEPWGESGEDLYVSCTMPSIEIGTVGGGTVLPAQAAMLDMLGVKGAHSQCPGENANQLARVVCGTVLAGELSLLSALAAGHLVKSHLKHNRSSTNMVASLCQKTF